MKIGIVGQGVSGLFLSLMIKKEKPSFDVTLIDKNPFPAKKMLATGNGRCNLGNLDLKGNSYNNENALNIVKEFDINQIIEFLKSIGVEVRSLDGLIYPFSLSARNLVDYLIDLAKFYKINFINNEKVIDYETKENKVYLKTNKKIFSFDKLIFACGNESSPQLGGESSIIGILGKHGYKICANKVGLAPIKTFEETKTIEKERVKGEISLIIDNEKVYSELGEVIFKNDGLSGIAVFNCASILARHKKFKKALIKIDLIPDRNLDELTKNLVKLNYFSKISVLDGFLSKPIAMYIRKRLHLSKENNYSDEQIKSIAYLLKNFEFTYKETYSFKDSQVTVGGIDFENLNEKLESKIDKNVYFAGEILNADGLCGGYNIMFAISSAHKVAESILN